MINKRRLTAAQFITLIGAVVHAVTLVGLGLALAAAALELLRAAGGRCIY